MRVKPITHLKVLELGFFERLRSFLCRYTEFDYLFILEFREALRSKRSFIFCFTWLWKSYFTHVIFRVDGKWNKTAGS